MASELKTALVPAITALATVAAALGGTYLGSRATQQVARDQLRHDDARHLYDLRRAAYVRMAQAVDAYLQDITPPAAVASKLDQDELVVRRAADVINIIGTESTSADANELFDTVSAASLATASSKRSGLVDKTNRLFDRFVEHARADIGTPPKPG